MTIRQLPGIGLLMCLAAAMPASAIAQQQQTPPPPAQETPVEKAAASVAGKWDMSAETPNGTTAVTLVIKLDGKKVTGTMTGPQGEIPMEGEFADGRLTMSITFRGDSGEMNITFTGATKEDGTLAGTFEFGQGPMKWTATRAKS